MAGPQKVYMKPHSKFAGSKDLDVFFKGVDCGSGGTGRDEDKEEEEQKRGRMNSGVR